MHEEKLFPQGIAVGRAFCNRKDERIYLKQCINANEHVVLLSPRRYGKTSLISQVLYENHFPSAISNLMVATNEQFAKNAIFSGACELLSQLLPRNRAIKQKLLGLFNSMNAKITLTAFGQSVQLSSSQSPQEAIIEVLLKLDQAAKAVNKQSALVFDEFQQIANIKDHYIIEAAIRHAVERSNYITYIFSGSNRHMLKQMFNSKSRPLYQLCDLMELKKISKNALEKYIQTAAKQKWGKSLAIDTLENIMNCTDLHIVYVNYLCRKLWKFTKLPNAKDIFIIWKDFVLNKNPWVVEAINNLSNNQKTVMAALAIEPTMEPTGQAFCATAGLSAASIRRVIDSLTKKDMVQKMRDGYYKLLDPAMATYFRSIHYLHIKFGG